MSGFDPIGGQIASRYGFGIEAVSSCEEFPLIFIATNGHGVDEFVIPRESTFPFEREDSPDVEL
jgi:hypothetical protein